MYLECEIVHARFSAISAVRGGGAMQDAVELDCSSVCDLANSFLAQGCRVSKVEHHGKCLAVFLEGVPKLGSLALAVSGALADGQQDLILQVSGLGFSDKAKFGLAKSFTPKAPAPYLTFAGDHFVIDITKLPLGQLPEPWKSKLKTSKCCELAIPAGGQVAVRMVLEGLDAGFSRGS